jgi:tripartite-type tricarboxylate transporter receptor subunit TctC
MKLRLQSITLLLLLLFVGYAEAYAATVKRAANVAGSTQDYPAKPVRIIDPFGAGGGPDLLARALALKLSELWGQPVTVENHPGAGATTGPALVAKSPADGYTLLINTSAQAYSAAISKNLPYDPLKDFIPIASLTNQPYVLVAGKPAGVALFASSSPRRRASQMNSSLALPAREPAHTWA